MNENEITVSVIIPMYNSATTIVRALNSLKNQTLQADEIIVVNDGSTDDSVVIVKDFHLKNSSLPIQVLHKINGGVSTARNAGMNAASGKFIALLDADDEWLPQKLQRQVETLRSHPEIDFLGCSRNNEILKIFWKEIKVLHQASVAELMIKVFPHTSTAIFKRELFTALGGYNEDMTHAEDGNLWVRYCAQANFYYLPESLVITGGGKPNFGFEGLSANLRAMQKGNEFTFQEARREGMISLPFFAGIYLYSKMKYLRRILITKLR